MSLDHQHFRKNLGSDPYTNQPQLLFGFCASTSAAF